MNAEELMRLDWVCLENDPTPRQVDWIRSGEVGLFWNKIVTPPYIKPIPLTPEILEKNGFERRDDLVGDDNFLPFVFERLDTDEYFEIIIYWRDSYCNGAADAFNEVSWGECWKLHILSGPSLYEYETGNCIYAHELQHALKLCKIQKEIIL